MFGGVQTLGLTALLREVVTSVLVPFMHCKGHAGRSRADLEGPSSTRALREHRVATLAHPANQSPACRDGQQLVNGPAALLRPSVQSTVSVPAHTPTTKRDPRFPLVAPWKKSEKKKERKKKKKKRVHAAPPSHRFRNVSGRAGLAPAFPLFGTFSVPIRATTPCSAHPPSCLGLQSRHALALLAVPPTWRPGHRWHGAPSRRRASTSTNWAW